MNLTEKELEDLIESTGKKFQDDTQFLIQRGWTQIEKTELEGERVFSVWISPDGIEYGHQNCLFGSNKWSSAIDRAERDLIDELGFESFQLSTTCPDLDDEFNKRRANRGIKELADDVWDGWVMFIHPISRRVYSYLEARDIARYHDMKDLDPSQCCGKTNDIQAAITEQKIVPQKDMNLFMIFVSIDEDFKYQFHSCKYQ